MTDRAFKMMMNRLPAGEYNANDLWALYLLVCTEKQKDISKYENNIRFWDFVHTFEEKKFGFEYMFKQKIRYIGTNDLHTLMVS